MVWLDNISKGATNADKSSTYKSPIPESINHNVEENVNHLEQK